MPLHLIALEPNQLLYQSEFEGYKLNLQDLPHYFHELESPVNRIYSDGVHANIFGPHNHLIVDPWDIGYSYYYVDDQQQVHHIAFDGRYTFQNRVVYSTPVETEGESALCMSFATTDIAVLSDAAGYIHIIDTGNRTKISGGKKKWLLLSSSLALGEKKSIVIVDCRIQEISRKQQLHCLVQSVERNDIIYNSIISWIIYEQDDTNTWKHISSVDLKGKGKVYYASMETNCAAVYVASDSPLRVTKETKSDHKVNQTETSKTTSSENLTLWSPKSQNKITVDSQEKVMVQELRELEDISAFVRLDTKTLQITHSIPLSDHDFLFSIKLENDEAAALALRHDMNACIWQPYSQLVDSEMWPVKHLGTLMAFGYIQSVKQNHKYMTCAPNLSYAVVYDGRRHIFVFESDNNPVSQGTRVMRTMQLEQEHIINVDKYGEVLGINATNTFLFVLTKTNFIAIRVR